MELQGAAAIVTGSSTGVGAATAKLLAERGCNVVINYAHNETDAMATAAACKALGVETAVVRADVSRDEDCRRLAAAAIERWGRIDALVNNAGTTTFAAHADLDALTPEDFQHVYAVNTIGPYMMTRAVVPHMKAAGRGAIVNVSSIAGITGIGSSIAYAASKGALITMTKSLARVLGPEIRVNAVCPGFIQGRWLREGLGEERYERTKTAVEHGTPLRIAATPEQVAESVLWFVEGATLVTGETLLADAGLHLGPSVG